MPVSRAEITGTVPTPESIMGTVDLAAQEAAKEARTVLAQVWEEEAPKGPTGELAHGNARVAKTATGWSVSVRPRRNQGRVARWVTRGTGLFRVGPGPKNRIRAKRRIPPKRMILPGGQKLWSVKGQHPNPFIERARDASHDTVVNVLRGGASKAAERLRGRRP